MHLQRVKACFDPLSQRTSRLAEELRLSRAVVIQQQRSQLWLEAHFSGCSAFQSRSSFCSGSSGTNPCRVLTLKALAREMGLDDAVSLLQKRLEEEEIRTVSLPNWPKASSIKRLRPLNRWNARTAGRRHVC